MTALLDRVPVDEITARGRQVRFSRVLATAFLGVFFLIGWLAGRIWAGTVDCLVAVRIGWAQGSGRPLKAPAPQPGQAPG